MALGNFLRKSLISFFVIVTCVTVLIGILGLIYEPDRLFGYEAYFSPIIFGVIGVLPSIVTYSRKELTVRQMLPRNILQLILLEGLVLSFGTIMGVMEMHMMPSIGLSVFIVFLVVHFMTWLIDSKKAKKLNEALKAFQAK